MDGKYQLVDEIQNDSIEYVVETKAVGYRLINLVGTSKKTMNVHLGWQII